MQDLYSDREVGFITVELAGGATQTFNFNAPLTVAVADSKAHAIPDTDAGRAHGEARPRADAASKFCIPSTGRRE